MKQAPVSANGAANGSNTVGAQQAPMSMSQLDPRQGMGANTVSLGYPNNAPAQMQQDMSFTYADMAALMSNSKEGRSQDRIARFADFVNKSPSNMYVNPDEPWGKTNEAILSEIERGVGAFTPPGQSINDVDPRTRLAHKFSQFPNAKFSTMGRYVYPKNFDIEEKTSQ